MPDLKKKIKLRRMLLSICQHLQCVEISIVYLCNVWDIVQIWTMLVNRPREDGCRMTLHHIQDLLQQQQEGKGKFYQTAETKKW